MSTKDGLERWPQHDLGGRHPPPNNSLNCAKSFKVNSNGALKVPKSSLQKPIATMPFMAIMNLG